jgi:hypothetical protein
MSATRPSRSGRCWTGCGTGRKPPARRGPPFRADGSVDADRGTTSPGASSVVRYGAGNAAAPAAVAPSVFEITIQSIAPAVDAGISVLQS